MDDIIPQFSPSMISCNMMQDIIQPLCHCRSYLSTTASVEPRPVPNFMGWSQLLTQVMKSSRFSWRHYGGICSSAVLDSLLRDWTNSMPYQLSCLNCSRRTCQNELAGRKVGILKKHTVFSTRCATLFCLVGQRTLLTRALSMPISTTARG